MCVHVLSIFCLLHLSPSINEKVQKPYLFLCLLFDLVHLFCCAEFRSGWQVERERAEILLSFETFSVPMCFQAKEIWNPSTEFWVYLGSTPSWLSPDHLQSRVPRRHPNQMPKPLCWFPSKKKRQQHWPYLRIPLDVEVPHIICELEPSHRAKSVQLL